MSTMNVSLPTEQVNLVDKIVSDYGFANRSEFFRSLLRLVCHKPDLLIESATFPFIVSKEKSSKNIIQAFKKTKKYTPEFLTDLEEGLKNSDFFQK